MKRTHDHEGDERMILMQATSGWGGDNDGKEQNDGAHIHDIKQFRKMLISIVDWCITYKYVSRKCQKITKIAQACVLLWSLDWKSWTVFLSIPIVTENLLLLTLLHALTKYRNRTYCNLPTLNTLHINLPCIRRWLLLDGVASCKLPWTGLGFRAGFSWIKVPDHLQAFLNKSSRFWFWKHKINPIILINIHTFVAIRHE